MSLVYQMLFIHHQIYSTDPFSPQILRNHVMVRVGGGWDTLDHFIAKHDPCRMKLKHISAEAARQRQIEVEQPPTNEPNTEQQTNELFDSSSLILVRDTTTTKPPTPRPTSPAQKQATPKQTIRKPTGSLRPPNRSVVSRTLPQTSDTPTTTSEISQPLKNLGLYESGAPGAPATSRRTPRNRSASMVTSPFAPPQQHWVEREEEEQSRPSRPTPRSGSFSRSKSARFVRRLSFNSVGDECVLTSSTADDTLSSETYSNDTQDRSEEEVGFSFTPLLSHRKLNKSSSSGGGGVVEGDGALRSFNQCPKMVTSTPARARGQSMIPVLKSTRSKSIERKDSNVVQNSPRLKHSKSGDITSSRRVTALRHPPRSLTMNPTSASARRIVKSKSSEQVSQHMIVSPRSAPGGGAVMTPKRPVNKPSTGLKKSKSSEIHRRNVKHSKYTSIVYLFYPRINKLNIIREIYISETIRIF
eukprot:sb/3464386/